MGLELAVRSVLLGVRFPSRLAVEHHDDLTGHVVGGEDRRDEPEHVQRRALGERVEQDLVLRPEAGERRHAGDRQPADDERGGGDRHQLAERAHLAHVLLVVHAVDHRAGAEEQQRLEEGVRHHVEDGGDVGARPDREEHVAELRHGRVGEHRLDVVLGDGDRGREQGGDHADPGDQRRRPRALPPPASG